MNTMTPDRRQALSPRLLLLLLGGDALVLLVFSAVGRSTHSLRAANPLIGVLLTAAPFLIGWGLVAGLLVVIGSVGQALTTSIRWLLHTALTCALAVLVSLVLRSLWLERPIVPMFAAVTMATVLAMMLFWRGLFWLGFRRWA